MLKKSLINLVNKSSAINNNNKDHEYYVRKCISTYLVENKYKINLDNTARWRTVTLLNTFVHLSGHGNCSGILIGPEPMPITKPPDRFLSAAHCLNAPGKPSGGPDFLRFNTSLANNVPIIARRYLGNWLGDMAHDVGLYDYNKPNQAFIEHIKNVYVLENPENIRSNQSLFKEGIMTHLAEVKYNNGLSGDPEGFRNYLEPIYLDSYARLQTSAPMIITSELLGYTIHRLLPSNIDDFLNEMNKKWFQIRNRDGTIMNYTSDLIPGDSGGPIFIPFGDDKIALVGVVSTHIPGARGIIAAVAPHINELETRYGLKIKRARIDYEHDDVNDDIRCPGTIIICPENTGTLANPDDLYREFNRINK